MSNISNPPPEWWSARWPDFPPKEVLSPSGLILLESGYLPIQVIFMDRLQGFRTYLGKPIIVNTSVSVRRGYRSQYENAGVNGASASWHMKGLAADITVTGLTPEQVFKAAINFGFTGAGLYTKHVHVDCRLDTPVIWKDKKDDSSIP